MFYSERHNEIMEILKERKNTTVAYLASQLHVSEPTIRRDLTLLQKSGKIRRTFGGAVINDSGNAEVPFSLREQENREVKDMLAARAAKYIKNGDVVFLDASSTASWIIKYLESFQDLVVITNSPKNTLKLAEKNINTISTGGLFLSSSCAYAGSVAKNVVEKFNADVFIFSCRGISDEGVVTDSSIDITELRELMMKHSKKSILMCTSDKIGKKYMYNLCRCEDVDEIICDKELDFNKNAQK